MSEANKLLLVDGHAYAYRSFHAIRSLNSPTGAPTNAIYGFIKALGKMRETLAPTHVAVVWDGGLHAARMKEHPDYKAQRAPMPDALGPQIGGIESYLQAAGIATYCKEGVEADDWIAALARRAAEWMPVVIASADKDFMQLVGPRIGLLNPNDKSEKIWTADDVRARTGVTPAQVVDWLSLIGDSVDNIPGVPGVGPKTATDLMAQFGSLDALLSRLSEIKSERIRSAVQQAEADLRRNQRLILLKEDEGLVPLEELAVKAPRQETLRGLFATWGFRSMLAALGERVTLQGALL